MAEEPITLQADFARPVGRFRALHGLNKGPLAPGGLLDVGAAQRALGPPLLRLHDCHWPNPDVVDMHAVFPNPSADPERPQSYDFRLTDEYLAAARATGAQIVYRLGESIEHTSIRRYAHPPADPERWAQAALGIIRHYNEGWAGGYRYQIPYWEIWNEPENRPAMWSGSDEDYFRLYRIVARAIKSRYPNLKVGGPAVGFTGTLKDGVFHPSPFVTAFLEFCRRERLPLDFFSWHCYTADSAELTLRVKALRRLLDSYGFTRTESHLNEWNYLPGNTWEPISRTASPEARQAYYARMSGAEGAAFIATALLELQDAPVDACCLFHGEVGAFGLFSEHGVPQPNYRALLAFHRLCETTQRVEMRGAVAGQLACGAGIGADRRSAVLLVSRTASSPATIQLVLKNLPWQGPSLYDLRLLDASHPLSPLREDARLEANESLTLPLPSFSLLLVTLRPANGA